MKTKMRPCTNCKEQFETEVDERGVSYNTRCPKCKGREKLVKPEDKGIYSVSRIEV